MDRVEVKAWREKPESPAVSSTAAPDASTAPDSPGPISRLLTPTASVTQVVTPAGLRPPDGPWQLGLHLARGQRVPRVWVGPAARAARDAARVLADAAGFDLRKPDAVAAFGGGYDRSVALDEGDPLAGLRARSPDAAGAVMLRALAPNAYRWEVEARVLAGQSPDEIAAATGLPVGHVERYEDWFFDVRPRLAATSYVIHTVIRWHDDGGDRTEKFWKLMAFNGGPLVLEAVMRAFVGGRLADAPDLVGDALDQDAMNTLLVRAAYAVHTTPAGPADVRWLIASMKREGKTDCRPSPSTAAAPFAANVRAAVHALQGYAAGGPTGANEKV